MQKGSRHVTLLGFELSQDFKDQHQMDSSPLDNGSIGFEKVDGFQLLVPTSTKACFELFDHSIGKSLQLEGPN
jgi:hypothetical protein